ncbi:4-hydroxy-3-methylbut-2-enyl diphosphate reductase [Caldinitratiruptor microaerophilus]|uniref:4-hydroxy-3-methylbut-2-enyl diphosphate reductase n=1 Tax=Caldinitratiruptor microaerophilus TaxID=671077 RepID=A0AA35CKQ8_9FIRM|nr:4-hydroxy-3-methylbut-2-enyl diphosphate reductase [Caldinitratiruptor microaerophilus]BDG61094.1 4-hydroxy-3-methylbut-2-enyl diphosphate reductase [Caldinitratiruptor microaerophilus]
MEVLKVTPRGYCHGVVDAVQIARRVAADPTVPRPIYILGYLVHNHHIVEELARIGVQTLDGPSRLEILESIEPPATVIFTAHGVSPQVRERAREKGLHVVDATCTDVTRTHDLIRDLAARGYEILYVGKRGHPEPEGALGVAPGKVHLIETAADLDHLHLTSEKIAVTTQTTMSLWDTQALIEQIRARYPRVEVYNEICRATQLRQEAIARAAPEADVVIVVGDRRSNNSKRLVQVAQEIGGREAYLVDHVGEVDPRWLVGRRRVAVTSGASTPTSVTREVIRFLEQFDPGAGGNEGTDGS